MIDKSLFEEGGIDPMAPLSPEVLAGSRINQIDHPKHYNMGRYEVIDVIEDWNLNFHLGNVVKYIARAPHKGNTLADLEKAAWYLEREMQRRRCMTEDQADRARAAGNL